MNMKIYLAGGAIRDKLLGKKVRDKDYVVMGATEAKFLKRFPKAKKVGAREAVYILDGDEYTLSAFKSIEDDLAGRDLTINAFLQDETGKIYAHPDARSDLKKKILRPVSEENFIADPLRVFRAARFSVSLPDFKFHASLLPLMDSIAEKGLLKDISSERVGNEVVKACSGPVPGNFLMTLSKTKAMDPWFTELSQADKVPAGPPKFHPESLLVHLVDTMNRLSESPLRVWMGLCHDLGKTATDSSLWPKHYGHDAAGEKIAEEIGDRLKLPSKFIRAGSFAAKKHMIAGDYDILRPGTKVDLLMMLYRQGIVEEMFELVRADKGKDFRSQAKKDLDAILLVKLPDDKKNLGSKSGDILKQLRCKVLSGE